MTPMPGTARLCKFHSSGGCTKGSLCPYSHDLTVNAVSNADATRGFVLTGHVVNLRVVDDANSVAKCPDSIHQMNPAAAPFVCSSEVYGTASSSYEQMYHQELAYPPLYDAGYHNHHHDTTEYYSHTAPYDAQAWEYDPDFAEDTKWTPMNVFHGTQQMRHAVSRFQVDYAEEVQPDPVLLQHRRMQAMRSPLQTKQQRSALSTSQSSTLTDLPEVSSRRRAPAAPPSLNSAAPLSGPLFPEKDIARVEVRSAEAHRRLRNRSES